MNKLEIELSNCFGIDSLNYKFSFEKGRTFSIYLVRNAMRENQHQHFLVIQNSHFIHIMMILMIVFG